MTTVPVLIDAPALWPAQAHVPTIAGRQLVVTGGEGCWVTTADGRLLYDGTAGLWHANVGHRRAELADAASAQMRKLETYHIFGRFTNDRALELAEQLASLSPIPDSKVILNSGGSDAIDVACKLARRHWQLVGAASKKIVLSREHAYHGLHAYGTSIAGLEFNREGYGTRSLVPETGLVSHDDIEQVRRAVLDIGPENIAAIVTEPIQGTGGVNPPAPGYLEGLQQLCREHDILLVLDEVITGFGRTGTMFAAERYGLTPDLLTFAKGITSGYAPLGGVLVGRRVWESFYADSAETPVFRHGATYAGHATASAVAIANLDLLKREHLVPHVQDLEAVLRVALAELARARAGVAEVRVAGFLGGVSLADGLRAEDAADALIERGFISRPLRGNTLQISPPFVTTPAEVRAFVAAIDDVVTEMGARL